MMICGYHFPFPGAGTIAKDGAGYALSYKVVRRAAPPVIIDMEITVKTCTLWLSAVLVAASFAAPAALAVDVVSSRDAPDLTAVRAKIKAKDFKAAIAELMPDARDASARRRHTT
jgi:hypothetical protein